MKKFLLAGGLASVLVLGACGEDEPNIGEDEELGEDAEDMDHGTSDQDEADNETGEESQDIDEGAADETAEGQDEEEAEDAQ
ncbi:DNA polymerase V family protein [Salinicoccus halitifaciens]|uniref:Nucleosome binding factor SPN SPT16 subunit n=1 Tax=Salinicoccus halitifaciens TaxID=1073415 RepID=A0ABV2E716_9STAP|nr:DNA polymerase V family protein [Salinicoccus halitifaciens]MCD2137096.1 DNA polymerase V family protein [Salinicoccus halitifaciens]